MTRGRSLVLRLVGGAAVWAAVLLIAGAVALTALYRQSILRTVDDRLESVVGGLVAAAEVAPDGTVAVLRRPTDPRYDQVFSGRYWQIGEGEGGGGDQPLVRSRSLWDETLKVPTPVALSATANPGAYVAGDGLGPDNEPLRVRAQAVQLPDREGLVIFAVAEDRRPADRDIRRFAITAAGLYLIFAAALAAGIILQVKIGLAPLFRMRNAVAEVREGRAERVEGDFPAELAPLGDELNSLLDHSRSVVERARTHVGNLAHALKTPIAVLVNESRTETGPLAELVTRQTGIMSRQVDHHLRRARAAAHAKAIGARTDVAPLVDDLVRTLRKIHTRRGVTIDAAVEDPPRFRGEKQDLEEMAGNLIDNACKWAASRVQVTARAAEDSGRLEIRVEDDGPGMDEAAITMALKRGVRLDENAPGTGLGLSIVDDLARAYGGELHLGRSEAGGLAATLLLPAASR